MLHNCNTFTYFTQLFYKFLQLSHVWYILGNYYNSLQAVSENTTYQKFSLSTCSSGWRPRCRPASESRKWVVKSVTNSMWLRHLIDKRLIIKSLMKQILTTDPMAKQVWLSSGGTSGRGKFMLGLLADSKCSESDSSMNCCGGLLRRDFVPCSAHDLREGDSSARERFYQAISNLSAKNVISNQL